MNERTQTESPREIVHGLSWLGVSNVVTKLLWAGNVIVLMHGLGPQGYGELATIWAIAGFAAGLSDLGTGQVMFRAGSRRPEQLRGYFEAAFRVKGVVSLLSWGLVVATCLVLLDRGSATPRHWIALLVLASGAHLIDHYQTFFAFVMQLCGRIERHAFWRATGFAITLVAFGAIVFSGGNALVVSIAFFAIMLGVTSLYRLDLGRQLRDQDATRPPLRPLIRDGLPFVTVAVLNLAFFRIDTVLVAVFGSTREAGIYSGQYQIVLLLYTLPAIVMTIMLPSLYRKSRDVPYLDRSLQRVSRYLNLAAWLATPMLFFSSEAIMEIVGGREFAEAHHSLRILSFMIPLFVFHASLDFLVAVDRLKWRIACESVALAMTTFGGALLIPRYSTNGMAAVAVAAVFVSGAIALTLLSQSIGLSLRRPLRDLIGMSVRIAPALACFFVPGTAWWLDCGLFFLAALLLLSLSRFWDEDDRRLFHQTIETLRNVTSIGSKA